MTLIEKIKKTIQRDHLLATGERVIIAVSGGPDSVTLLYVLHQIRQEWGLQLKIAHFNHGLRASAKRDEQFVRKIANQLQLTIAIGYGHLSKKIKKGSLEEMAREARLKFLIETAQNFNADCVALGHTQDDLAETVLMRILRGTGAEGLRGILPQRKLYGTSFIRPLLGVNRQEIEQFLKKNKIPFRTDPTNQHMQFTRNKIRKQLLPLLKKEYSPNVKGLLANLAQTMATDYDYLESQAQKALNPMLSHQKSKKSICLKIPTLKKFHPSLQRIILRSAIERLKGDTKRLTFNHILDIENLIGHLPDKSMLHLPTAIAVQKKNNILTIIRLE